MSLKKFHVQFILYCEFHRFVGLGISEK